MFRKILKGKQRLKSGDILHSSGLKTDRKLVDHVVIEQDYLRELRFSNVMTGLIAIGILLIGLLIFVSFVPLASGASAVGVVAVEQENKILQHQYGGTVEKIYVQEGDLVEAGELIIKLDATEAKSRFDAAYIQYVTNAVRLARLVAERDGLVEISFPETLFEYGRTEIVSKAIDREIGVFKSRRENLTSGIALHLQREEILNDYINGLQA